MVVEAVFPLFGQVDNIHLGLQMEKEGPIWGGEP